MYKFLLGWERRRDAIQIEEEIERLDNGAASVPNSNNSNSNNETNFYTATEQVDATKTIISNSPNLKQLLNDSEDMDLMLCSQRVEQEVSSRKEPVKPVVASKGFSEITDDGTISFFFKSFNCVLKHKN